MSDTAHSTASKARQSTIFRAFARAGFAANGLINLLIGFIAIGVAIGGVSSKQASQSGAIEDLLKAPGGAALVVLVAIGAVALAIWLVTEGILAQGEDAKEKWADRIKNFGKAIAYGAIAVISINALMTSGGGGGGNTEESLTAKLLSSPGGVILVALVALVAIGVGGYMVVKGIKKKFQEDIRMPHGVAGTAVTVVGMVGYIARGIAIATIGVLFGLAAINSNAGKAGGMSDALASLASLPAGTIVLLGIAIGFIAYGLYSFVRAVRAKL